MPIKETYIETSITGLEGRENVPVFYTDELRETSVYDFAYSSILADYLPYLFVGYFTDGQQFHKWYFSNARKHEEMQQAIERDLGRTYSCTFGQIWFKNPEREQGKLYFKKLSLHSDLPNNKDAREHLLNVIRPDYLCEDFRIV